MIKIEILQFLALYILQQFFLYATFPSPIMHLIAPPPPPKKKKKKKNFEKMFSFFFFLGGGGGGGGGQVRCIMGDVQVAYCVKRE